MTRTLDVFFDSCALRPPDKNERMATDQILELAGSNSPTTLVSVGIPEAVLEETDHIPLIRGITSCYIYSLDLPSTEAEQKLIFDIKDALFKRTHHLSRNQENDARILFNARKYAADYLVTFDRKHLLAKRGIIQNQFDVRVATPTECLRAIQEYLATHPTEGDPNLAKRGGNTR